LDAYFSDGVWEYLFGGITVCVCSMGYEKDNDEVQFYSIHVS